MASVENCVQQSRELYTFSGAGRDQTRAKKMANIGRLCGQKRLFKKITISTSHFTL